MSHERVLDSIVLQQKWKPEEIEDALLYVISRTIGEKEFESILKEKCPEGELPESHFRCASCYEVATILPSGERRHVHPNHDYANLLNSNHIPEQPGDETDNLPVGVPDVPKFLSERSDRPAESRHKQLPEPSSKQRILPMVTAKIRQKMSTSEHPSLPNITPPSEAC